MLSLRLLAPLAAVLATVTADPQSCNGSSLPASCQNNTIIEDTCCFVAAGQLVLTQFWDTDPVTGPEDSWTVHGLWPDWCDGSYPANCDQSREYSNISDILTAKGGESTLTEMEKYWKDYEGDDESFWEHEWSKHGTCVSTLEPDCYTDYEATEEAVDYFQRTMALFKSLPTYKWLDDAGITPSESETYTADEIEKALEKAHGAPVTISCKGGELNEVWYHFNVKGSLQEGKFLPVEPTGTEGGGCSGQVSYIPKTGGNKGRRL